MRFELVPMSKIKPNDGKTYLYYDFEHSFSELYFGEITEIIGPEEFSSENYTFFRYEFKFKQPRIEETYLQNGCFDPKYNGFEEKSLFICFNEQTFKEVSLDGYFITQILEGQNDG